MIARDLFAKRPWLHKLASSIDARAVLNHIPLQDPLLELHFCFISQQRVILIHYEAALPIYRVVRKRYHVCAIESWRGREHLVVPKGHREIPQRENLLAYVIEFEDILPEYLEKYYRAWRGV
jgi:hypothetical protein